MRIINNITILFLLLLIFLAGCNKPTTFLTLNQCQNSYDNLVINYSVLERNYKEYVLKTTQEIQECKNTIIEKDILIYDVIRWNETIYNNTWNMSYPQTAKVTKISFWYVVGILIAEFLLGISVWGITENKGRKRFIGIVISLIILLSAILIYYFFSLRYS
ncbi:hypothetical protein J4212_05670 [Candidatus Woesearchaeota archaeon]|nr:hypothetical protein [Candidatus Woesearchaeota archaeon]